MQVQKVIYVFILSTDASTHILSTVQKVIYKAQMQVQKVIYVFILSTDASTKSNISIHIKHRCKYKK